MDKLISIYWFAILTIVAVAVVYMVAVFYSQPYDVREVEVNLLVNKVADCLSRGGELSSDLFYEGNFNVGYKDNFLETCGITFNTERDWIELQYYFLVEFFNIDLSDTGFFLEEGSLNLISSCDIQDEGKYERLAECVEKRFYAVSDGKQYLIKILGIVRKTEKNVN
ncbi:MAG: hypothetical protein KKB31_00295 [Nanoarchaeota archaeon]|nr:hypothetical protein [Nanoarchaeota archaeon]